jgi:hypothetical protein
LKKNQDKLKSMIKEQSAQIAELLKKLDATEIEYDSKAKGKGKGKKKIDNSKPFYHVTIYFFFVISFYLCFPIFIFICIMAGCC